MSFEISALIGDPFAISTLSFSVISWIVAIAGAGASDQSKFPHFTWWGIVYQLVVIIFILVFYLFNIIELYKFTLVGLLSIAFVYTTNSVNQLIYHTNDSGNSCCAAGCILLSMVDLIWILYFGGHPESPTNQFIDSFSLKKHIHTQAHLPSSDDKVPHIVDDEEYKGPISPVMNNQFQDSNLRQSQLTNAKSTGPYMSSSQLNGLENFSSSDVNQRDLTSTKRQTIYNDTSSNNNAPSNTFRYKAKALYSYDANPEDINEISFVKDEILEVDDIDGKWWQARRANGQVGICPSNYVKLLD
ncbi:Piso0_004575 [Millerozyma farinosa CBS 7064]|uniref:High osmolarity signaling protein SHO1 n=1 Tax=Pichia sorbitophila (strain ATCC MYA-4447 / BCRC 22081 / CBS 7064 / NBRC 10061 / NRRL Y-12695) TaxID=559304 RepID=G8Y964_PICSO|nr:Piso0_004575 [Millerozyma farinosa CBS 7064]CCE85009.1 Piso0_004575 [Millerozyma farinosa CBS 7064]